MDQVEIQLTARQAAIAVFESVATADKWLAEPCLALGGVKPSSLLCDEEGLALVLRELAAIEHGLPL